MAESGVCTCLGFSLEIVSALPERFSQVTFPLTIYEVPTPYLLTNTIYEHCFGCLRKIAILGYVCTFAVDFFYVLSHEYFFLFVKCVFVSLALFSFFLY